VTGAPGTVNSASSFGAVASGSSQTFSFKLQHTTATDNMLLQSATLQLVPGI
jgi:hypothetical protein